MDTCSLQDTNGNNDPSTDVQRSGAAPLQIRGSDRRSNRAGPLARTRERTGKAFFAKASCLMGSVGFRITSMARVTKVSYAPLYLNQKL